MLDKLMADRIHELLFEYIIPQQHGFVRGRPTLSNLAVFTHFVNDAFSKGSQCDVVYTDYSRAFDSVNHQRLVDKLHNYGFRGPLLRWFDSYLRDRTQSVKIKNNISESFSVTSGVPQGSHLGPIFFYIIHQ